MRPRISLTIFPVILAGICVFSSTAAHAVLLWQSFGAPYKGIEGISTNTVGAATATASGTVRWGDILIDTSGSKVSSVSAKCAVYVYWTPNFTGTARIITNSHIYGKDSATVLSPWGYEMIRSTVYLQTNNGAYGICEFRNLNLTAYKTTNQSKTFAYYPCSTFVNVAVRSGQPIRIWAGAMTNDAVITGCGYFSTSYKVRIDNILIYRTL